MRKYLVGAITGLLGVSALAISQPTWDPEKQGWVMNGFDATAIYSALQEVATTTQQFTQTLPYLFEPIGEAQRKITDLKAEEDPFPGKFVKESEIASKVAAHAPVKTINGKTPVGGAVTVTADDLPDVTGAALDVLTAPDKATMRQRLELGSAARREFADVRLEKTTAQWAVDATPIPLGAQALDTSTGEIRVGDGVNPWANTAQLRGPVPGWRTPPVSPPVITDRWELDDDLNPSVGSTVMVAADDPVFEPVGNYGGALCFDGDGATNARLTVNDARFAPNVPQWWYMRAMPRGFENAATPVLMRNFITVSPWWSSSLEMLNTRVQLRTNDTANAILASVPSNDSFVPALNEWHSYAIQFLPEGDDGFALRLWVDGVEQETSGLSFDPALWATTLGAYSGTTFAARAANGQGFHGCLDTIVRGEGELTTAFVQSLDSEPQTPPDPGGGGGGGGTSENIFGVGTIFGGANKIPLAQASTHPFFADGLITSVTWTGDWVDFQPTAPACRNDADGCSLQELENATYNWSDLDGHVTKLLALGGKVINTMIYHGNKVPTWMFDGPTGAQCTGDCTTCPTVVDTADNIPPSTSKVTNWGQFVPGKFVSPTYAQAIYSPTSTVSANPYDKWVPLVGCTHTWEGYLRGGIPDQGDADYQLYYRGMVRAFVKHMKELLAANPDLIWGYHQATTGRSGDPRVVAQPKGDYTIPIDGTHNPADKTKRPTIYLTYDKRTGQGVANPSRTIYPNDWFSGGAIKTNIMKMNWRVWIEELGANTMNPLVRGILINIESSGVTELDQVIQEYATLNENRQRIYFKTADATQGEGLSLLGNKAGSVVNEAEWSQVRRGEIDETFKEMTNYGYVANCTRYWNCNPERESYWIPLQALHAGVDFLNTHTSWDWAQLYGDGTDQKYDELREGFKFFNRHVGIKNPTGPAPGGGFLEGPQESDDATKAPGAWIALRKSVVVKDQSWKTLQPAQRVAYWDDIIAGCADHGCSGDSSTLQETGYNSVAIYARVTKKTSTVSYAGYGGNYTYFLTQPDANQTIGWWNVGPTFSRFGKYAVEIAGGNGGLLNLLVDPEFIKTGASYRIKVTWLDRSGQGWSMKYRNAAGNLVALTPTVTGASAAPGVWQEVSYVVPSLGTGAFNLQLIRGAGNPLFHMVYVEEM